MSALAARACCPQALLRFVRRCGSQAAVSDLVLPLDAAALANQLNERGVPCELVDARGAESSLSLPALAFGRDGPDLVVIELGANHMVVEVEGRLQRVPAAVLRTKYSGVFLQRSSVDVDPNVDLRAAIVQLFRAEWRRIAQVLLLGTVVGALTVAGAQVLQRITSDSLPFAANGMLLALVTAMALAGAGRATANFMQDVTAAQTEATISFRLLHIGFARLLGGVKCGAGEGNLESLRCLEDGAKLLLHSSYGLLLALPTLVLCGVVLAFAQPLVALLALGSYGLCIAFIVLLQRTLFTRRSREVALQSEQREALIDTIGLLPSLKASGLDGYSFGRWYSCALEERLARVDAEKVRAAMDCAIDIARVAFSVGLVVLAWREVLDQGVVGVFLSTIALGEGFNAAAGQVAAAVVERVEAQALLSAVPALHGQSRNDGARELPSRVPAIELTKVSYRYPGASRPVLVDFDLTVWRGELVILRGASGAGKSTLARLISGLIVPTDGEVTIFARPSTERSDHVMYVPQDIRLLDGSIAHNLRTISGASDVDIEAAGRACGLNDWLASLPMGAETLVTAGGGNFSAGQRQLILLTAASASRRSVVVLDEPTAHLDAAALARFDWRAFFGKAVILISHDSFLPAGARAVTVGGPT